MGYCLIGEGSVVRQRETDLPVRARVYQAIIKQGKEFNILYYLIVLYCQENKLLFYKLLFYSNPTQIVLTIDRRAGH